jgi:hypothetical protein
MSLPKMVTKVYPILLPEAAWKLLGMYHVVLNRQLLESGYRQSNLAKTLGAILTQYLVANEKWIREEFYRVKAEVARDDIPRFYDSDQLARIETASATEIPNALRIGWSGRVKRANGRAA